MAHEKNIALEPAGEGRVRLVFSGHLDVETASGLIMAARNLLAAQPAVADVTVVLDRVDYFDSAGAAVIIEISRWCTSHGARMALSGASAKARGLLDLLDIAALAAPAPVVHSVRINLFVRIGGWALVFANDIHQMLVFLGDFSLAIAYAIRHPRALRVRETLFYLERAGVDAVPIVTLINFLLGVTLAFMGANQLRQFGANIYVADLVGVAVAQELGPLMTAILVAGRSGAAFAAEIGTMRVNQEVDAMTTMGLDPVRFLVTPRIIAAVLMTPLLTLFANLVGLIGGAITMRSFSIPIVTFLKEVDSAVTMTDFMAGFVKSFVFAILVAGIGCLRGLQTGAGASAVGDSATKAVVSGIILLVVVDGIFAVVYYMLNI